MKKCAKILISAFLEPFPCYKYVVKALIRAIHIGKVYILTKVFLRKRYFPK